MTAKYVPDATKAIQAVYNDPVREQLADRLEVLLDLLDTDEGLKDPRLYRHRMQEPKFWLVKVHGSKVDFAFMWEVRNGDVWVMWAGDPYPL